MASTSYIKSQKFKKTAGPSDLSSPLELFNIRGEITFFIRVNIGLEWFSGSFVAQGGVGPATFIGKEWRFFEGNNITFSNETTFRKAVFTVTGFDGIFTLEFGNVGENHTLSYETVTDPLDQVDVTLTWERPLRI